MMQLGLNFFFKFADGNFVVCFPVVKELSSPGQEELFRYPGIGIGGGVSSKLLKFYVKVFM